MSRLPLPGLTGTFLPVLLVNGQHHIGIFSSRWHPSSLFQFDNSFADRDIAKGDELTLSYGETYWLEGRPWEEAVSASVTEIDSE